MRHFSRFFLLLSALLSAVPAAAGELTIPAGYERQVLDVTQGEMRRPVGWHYSWFTTHQGVVWTVSKEDASKGPYNTGMRIQLVPGVKAVTGKTAEEVSRGFLASKVASAKVLNVCAPRDVGDFKVVCLETLEPARTPGLMYRILYSVSWSVARDWSVISTFGAPEPEWSSVQPVIAAMSEFVLVGPGFGTRPATPAAPASPGAPAAPSVPAAPAAVPPPAATPALP